MEKEDTNKKGLSDEEVMYYIEICEKGTPEEREWAGTILVEAYEKYIHYYIHHYTSYQYSTEEYQDIFQNCMLAFWENKKDYSAELGKPTTFFARYIQHGITEMNAFFNNQSEYYAQCVGVLRRVMVEEDTAESLSKKTGMSIKTVKLCLGMINYPMLHYSGAQFLEDSISETMNSAEEIWIVQEKYKALKEVFNKLSYIEKQVIGLNFGYSMGNQKRKNIKEIAKELDMSEPEVKNIKKRALGKLKKMYENAKWV